MKKRILIVTPDLNVRSGVANHIMNYYKNIKKEFDIDFIIFENNNSPYIKELENNNVNIYYFNKSFSKKNILKVKEFFKVYSKKYDIIHCHSFNYGIIYLYYAFKYNIKHRIIHIHSIRYSDNIIKHFINKILLRKCVKFSNHFFACSNIAGKKAFKSKDFSIINNGIDISRYKNINKQKKLDIKADLGIKSEFIFGNVGRLVKQKNHKYLIHVFKELKKTNFFDNPKLLIIGDGPEYKNIKKLIDRYDLGNDIIFKNNISNIYDFYGIMDCFLFPSKKEGLGLVLIEAQASGLPCFCTNTLPQEVFVSKQICGLKLTKDYNYWVNEIINSDLIKRDVTKEIIYNGFDINHESRKLIDFYNNCN